MYMCMYISIYTHWGVLQPLYLAAQLLLLQRVPLRILLQPAGYVIIVIYIYICIHIYVYTYICIHVCIHIHI